MTAQTLSLCILTKNSGSRLTDVLVDGRTFADEIVVGVDATSTDDTFDEASRLADVVFRFEHIGIPEHARLIPLELATSEWILSLDDDERMDSAFRELRSDLVSDQRYTHYWFPRKWLVRMQPPAYLDALPWFPDWQLRLFRNDRRLVWCPPRAHQPYAVIGTGCLEDRTAIVHYERVVVDEDARRRKVVARRDRLGSGQYEEFYGPVEGVATKVLENRPILVEEFMAKKGATGKLMQGIQPGNRAPLPPWSAALSAPEANDCSPGRQFVTEVRAVNRGGLRWVPPQSGWPRLFLSYHLRDAQGAVLQWDGERTPVGRIVDPGGSMRLYAMVTAPAEPGDYVLEWDMVSEDECWFAECGSATATTAVHVDLDEKSPRRASR